MLGTKILKRFTKLSLLTDAVRCKSMTTVNSSPLPMGNNTGPLKYLGQPTYDTHPHLIKPGEIVPYVTAKEFQERRQNLINLIVTQSKKRYPDLMKHIIVIPSATKKYMTEKIPYVFRQNSDFLYLTGCQEPDTCLILSWENDKTKTTLFMRDNDPHSEIWDGPRTNTSDAVSLFGVDQALPFQELEQFMKCHVQPQVSSILWYDFMNPTVGAVHKVMKIYFNELLTKIWDTPKNSVHKLRLIKSSSEIALMKRSCEIASEAISRTIRWSKPGVSEHEIFASVDYESKMLGAEMLAYPPVIAGGDRATVIHYINNNQVVNNGEMILMDAGCEFHGYSADITRTWPVNGYFRKEQGDLYEALLSVQLELIDALKSQPTLDQLFDKMCILLSKRLQELGILSKTSHKEIMAKEAYSFCPHHVSHYLGMDVHDTPSIPRNIPVQPGMIVTVEPGIYINYKHKVPKEFQGIGIRIEDDVLITENGPVVLTAKCPKSKADIEAVARYKG